ncbi:unnamed protein product [Effrenium voratum]|nr:unnamed protein product [Effrenium voratum]
MISMQQSLFYGSLVVLSAAVLAAYFVEFWAVLEASLDNAGDFIVSDLFQAKNIFVLSAAYARWALPYPGSIIGRPEPALLKALGTFFVGVIAGWSLNMARETGSTSLDAYKLLFLVHVNSFVLTAAVTFDRLTGSWVLLVEALALWLCCTSWWHPAAALAVDAVNWVIPVQEVTSAVQVLRGVIGAGFDQAAMELLVVSGYIQISLGYVNVWYMRQVQARTNALLDVAGGKMTARQFLVERTAVYMVSVALPYMLQRSVLETANDMFFESFRWKAEESLRVDAFLHPGNAYNRLEVARDSNHTVDGFAEAFNSIINDCYQLTAGKLYDLPNLVLMSGMMASQPILTATLLPISVGLDFGRTHVISAITSLTEKATKHLRALADKRKKVEQHDSRNAEAISRTGAAAIVAGRWGDLATDILAATAWRKILLSTRMFINWLYYQDLYGVGVECALARIMEADRITAADIGVYSMVIEDTIGTLLTRYREESRLAQMHTFQERLLELDAGLRAHRARLQEQSHCMIQGGGALLFRDFTYERGDLKVQLPDLDLQLGRIYAITGPNGCGSLAICVQRFCRGQMSPWQVKGLRKK